MTMNAAALLNIKAELDKLRHKGTLTIEQFGLLKGREKYGGVTEQILALLNRAWGLRCDGTLDDEEFAEDIEMMISEMPQPGGSSSTVTVPAPVSQSHSVPSAAPATATALASKTDNKRSAALAKAAKSSLNIMSAFICGSRGKPVCCYPPFSECSERKVVLPLLPPAAEQYVLRSSRCLTCNKNKVHGIKLFSDRLCNFAHIGTFNMPTSYQ